MKIRSAGATDVGKVRSSNEDSFGVFDDLGLYVVADGMGGHAAGEVASFLAVETIHETFLAPRDASPNGSPERTTPTGAALAPERRLVSALEQANRRIFAAGQEDEARSGMGTTVAAVWLDGKTAHVAHVGDSRVYRVRGGDLAQITTDHSLVNDYLARGLMTPEEAIGHPMKHILIRALGTTSAVAVDTTALPLEPGDILLLCSDGLSNVVPPSEIAAILSAPDLDISVRCHGLIDAANRHGGLDNITAVLLQADTLS
jgi:protein phosphatase